MWDDVAAVMEWSRFLFVVIHCVPDWVCHHKLKACIVCYCHLLSGSDANIWLENLVCGIKPCFPAPAVFNIISVLE